VENPTARFDRSVVASVVGQVHGALTEALTNHENAAKP
jgi:hypothetical protein